MRFALVTFLFFAWGFITCLNDILIPHLKSVFSLGYTEAALIQFAFFIAYFAGAIPAGTITARLGYQKTLVAGLATCSVGAAMFWPAAQVPSFALFLLALFILALGITVLQVAANPYVTLLGSPETASSRLTLTQAFNSLGTAIAPWVGGWLILQQTGSVQASEAQKVQGPYLAIAFILLSLAMVFAKTPLPMVSEKIERFSMDAAKNALKSKSLRFAVFGIFVYVGAEVSIGSFLVNYLVHVAQMATSELDAAKYVSIYWTGAMIGRFAGGAIMQKVSGSKVLASAALAAAFLVGIAGVASGTPAGVALMAVGLCNSIMFPTIFALGVRGLGALTSIGSSLLVMAIVGGAIMPLVVGSIADASGLKAALVLPALCYAYIVLLLTDRCRCGRCCGRFFLFLRHHHPDELHKEDVKRESNDHEIHDFANEEAIRNFFLSNDNFPAEVAFIAGQQKPDGRHQNIFHQGVDNLAKSGSDDHTDCHVDHVAFKSKRFEFFQSRHCVLCGTVCVNWQFQFF
jgi:FHS family L-fucose permease-like MFS transporter